jgi:hypothetical protein
MTKYLFFPLLTNIIIALLIPIKSNAQLQWDWFVNPTSIHTVADVGIGTTNGFVPEAQLHIKKIACDWVTPTTGPVAFQRFELDMPFTQDLIGDPPNQIYMIRCVERKKIWDIKIMDNGLYFQHQSFPLINSTQYDFFANSIFLGNTGNVGIGTLNPESGNKLEVIGGEFKCNQDIILGNNDWYFDSRFWANGDVFGIYPSNPNHTGWLTDKGFRLFNDGKVAIGIPVSLNNTDYRLSVEGKIVCQQVVVNIDGWPDYVFKPEYKLLSLPELSNYITKNKHLPGIPTDNEMIKNGNNLGNTDSLLMLKIEELTLYLIDQQKQIEELQMELKTLRNN